MPSTEISTSSGACGAFCAAAATKQIAASVTNMAKTAARGKLLLNRGVVFIHDTTPPGAPVMAKLRNQIRYQYFETDRGAKIQITTANAEALAAIYAFLRFQISDHQTGDATEISAR